MPSIKLIKDREKDTCPFCNKKAKLDASRRITASPPLYRSQYSCKCGQYWSETRTTKPIGKVGK